MYRLTICVESYDEDGVEHLHYISSIPFKTVTVAIETAKRLFDGLNKMFQEYRDAA